MKDLGPLHFFIGIGLFLTSSKYIHSILEDYNL